MCHEIHSITFDCACKIADPTDPRKPIAMHLCAESLTHNDGVVCANFYLHKQRETEHHPHTCMQHAFQTLMTRRGSTYTYAPKKTSFATVEAWYNDKESSFAYHFAMGIYDRRIENFFGRYLSEGERERRWVAEVQRPMFGCEFVDSAVPEERGWKRFVGVTRGSATALPTKEEVMPVAEVKGEKRGVKRAAAEAGLEEEEEEGGASVAPEMVAPVVKRARKNCKSVRQ